MAFPDLSRAIEISPHNHDAYFKRADAYIGLGQMSLALEDLEQAVRLAPTKFDYLYGRGQLHNELGDYDSAIEDFDGAIALKEGLGYVDPRHTAPFLDRGRIYLRFGDYSQALEDGMSAMEFLSTIDFDAPEWESYKPILRLKMANAYELEGDAYTELHRFGEAKDVYDRAVDLRAWETRYGY